jgi:hypothetical protein
VACAERGPPSFAFLTAPASSQSLFSPAINGDPDASFNVPPTAAVDGHSFVPDTGRILDMLRDQSASSPALSRAHRM